MLLVNIIFDSPLLLVKKTFFINPIKELCCYTDSHLLLTFKQRVQRWAVLDCPSDATRAQVSGTLVLK